MPASSAGSPDLVFSQVYGGGGNAGAPYDSKFVELFNRGTSVASLGGMSLQYASASGTAHFASNVLALPDVLLPAGGYYLVGLTTGANGSPLPAPDLTGSINPAATSGKFILARTTAGLACNGGSAPCTSPQLAVIVDLVGYGGANWYEGSAAAPALSNTTAALRRDAGCTDTDDNGADFTSGAPSPRSSRTPLNPCQPPEPTVAPTS
ncbi:MAG TPA: lamin tail domain-containing protein, partial [Candidatus Limnocylindrales bacterium]|nr:lamin tail domain-containing protein [Candidatus Limnocylindrales bacterium]